MAALLISPALSADAFRDVSRTQWYYDAVNYVVENKYMNGIDAHTFAPEVPVTRGVLVTVLYRMDGTPGGYSRTSFSDVKRGSYYEAAVAWASANGIVTGYSSTKFGPNDPVTREQFAAILYRYAGYKGVDEPSNAKLSQYDDYPQISAYAIPAMRWANENGFLTGTSQTTLRRKERRPVRRQRRSLCVISSCRQTARMKKIMSSAKRPKMTIRSKTRNRTMIRSKARNRIHLQAPTSQRSLSAP